jgi:hypothetical protein
MKAAGTLPIGNGAFPGGPSSPSTREGCTRIGPDGAWREIPARTSVAAPRPSEVV